MENSKNIEEVINIKNQKAMTLPEFEPGLGPVLMLNLLKFKDRTVYFKQYVPAFNQVVSELGIEGVRVTLLSKVVAAIVAAENESWDEMVLVEYPDADAFKTIAESQVYHVLAEPYRQAALADLKLLMIRKIEL